MKNMTRMAKRPSLLKARILSPFAKRYRDRVRIADEPEALKIISSDILLTNDRRLAFVKNSKAGCTTVAHALYYYNHGHRYDGSIHQKEANLMQGLNFAHAGVSALKNKDVYKFTFVRNPTKRIVSAFNNFVFEQTNRGARKHLKLMVPFGYDADNDPHDNFNAFLDYIGHSFSISKNYTDKHFRPQVVNTAYGHVEYDHIARLENYNDEMQYILEQIGVWDTRYLDLLTIKANASRTASFSPTATQLQMIGELYSEDYKAFAYPMPDDDADC